MRPIALKIYLVAVISVLSILSQNSNAQLRQMYVDPADYNEVSGMSFWGQNVGFVAFTTWFGATTDSGRNYIPKPITMANTNYNGHSVNLTFGFTIKGLKAFNANNLLVYGDYGFVPAILRSTDGGNTFTLVFHSQFNPLELRTGIMDMVFPENGQVGFAIDADRILKTTDQGATWSVVRIDPAARFTHLTAPDNNTVIATNTEYQFNKVVITTNGGVSWSPLNLPLPGAKVKTAFFLNASTGWLSLYDSYSMYKTTDGGATWVLQNHLVATPFLASRLHFIDSNTGYALSDLFFVHKTVNGGGLWEQLERTNSYEYLGYSHSELFFLNNNQFWAGGGHGFLEMTNNAGGYPLPAARFYTDTTGVAGSGVVNLTNYSRPGYNHKWFVNDQLISTSYHASYNHVFTSLSDTIKLIVTNLVRSDTLEQIQFFHGPDVPIPYVGSYSPDYGWTGRAIDISGDNFINVTDVKFGGISASSFIVQSQWSIRAIIDSGASGDVTVINPFGSRSLPGFRHISPLITSFSPTSATYGDTVTIRGVNFTSGGLAEVKFGGVNDLSYSNLTDTSVDVVVGLGASGNVTFTNNWGTATKGGFVYIPLPPPPIISGVTPLQAGLDDIITITGTNFSHVTSVKFDSVEARSFTVVSPTTITAVVDTGATGYVYVTTYSGIDSLAGFQYKTPVIKSFNPAIGGPGAAVTISGLNFTGITSVQFGGINAASFSVLSDTSILAIVDQGESGVVSVTSSFGTHMKAGFIFSNVPRINSISNTSGAIGSTVQLVGSGFSANTTENIVYFGAAKAAVTSATTEVLTVIVPAGSSYDNITVTTTRGSFKSDFKFVVTFPGGMINAATYATQVDLPTRINPRDNMVVDLDGDNLPDLVIKSLDTLSYFRNISTPGNIAFEQRIDMPVAGIWDEFKYADMNNDGKIDLLFFKGDSLMMLLNSSTLGTISFQPLFYSGIQLTPAQRIATGDFNNDGKQDLVLIRVGGGDPNVYLNTTTGTNVSFAPAFRVRRANQPNAKDIEVCDIDFDGRADIIVQNRYTNDGFPNAAFAVLLNTYDGTNLSFSSDFNFGPVGDYYELKVGDLNGDKKPDVAFAIHAYYTATPPTLHQQWKVAVYENNSTPGNPAFTPGVINHGGLFTDFTVGNVNGDALPEILFTFDASVPANNMHFRVLQNNSTADSLKFSFASDYSSPYRHSYPNMEINSADIDGDGRPEVIISSFTSPITTIFKNNQTSVQVVACENSNATIASPNAGSTFQWQVNNGTGFADLTNVAGYSGVTSDTLQMDSVPLAWSGQTYRCVVDGVAGHMFTLIVNPLVVPTVSVTAPTTPLCSGVNVTFSASTNFGGDTPVFQWLVNGLPVGTNDSTFITGSLNNNDELIVKLTSSYSCAPLTPVASMPLMISLATPLTPSVSITTTAHSICAGTAVHFVATPVNGGTNPSYEWLINGFTFGTNSSTFSSVGLEDSSEVQVVMTSNHSCLTIPGDTSNMELIRVRTVTPEVGITSTATSICAGTAVTFQAVPHFGGDTPVFSWEVNGITVFGNSNVYTTSTLNNNDQVSVTMTSSDTCANSAVVTSDPIIMGVSSSTPSVTISSPTNTICAGTALTFTATPVNGGQSPAYQWQVNGADVGTSSDVYSSALLNDGDVVQVIMTSSDACSISPLVTSNSITVSVVSVLVPSVTISATSTNICEGTAVMFTASPVDGGNTPIYQWKVNGADVGTAQETFVSSSLQNGDAITVTMTSSNTCASPATVTSNVINMLIRPLVIPTVALSHSPSEICDGDDVLFTASVTNQGDNPHYQWRRNNLPVGTNASTFQTSTLESGDIIDVVLTSNAACISQPSVTSSTVTITEGRPFSSVTIAGATTVMQDSSVMITATAVNGGSTPTFQWQDSSNLHNWQTIAGATSSNLLYQPLSSGTRLKCNVTSNAACANGVISTSNVLEFVVMAGRRSSNFYVYPNPATNQITIDSISTVDNWEMLLITNSSGSRVYMNPNISGITNLTIDVSNFIAGMYTVTFRRRNGQSSSKQFIKQ